MKPTARRLLEALLAGLSGTCLGIAADEPAKTPAPEVSVTPIVTYINVDKDREKFREDYWMRDGWTGGIEEFTLEQKFGKNSRFIVEGRGIFDAEDYRLTMEVVKPDCGFVRAGFTQYRKYFDGTGGFYPLFSTRSFDIGKDLDLDIGNIFVDVGLTLPNVPKLTLGYERQYKNGAKSMIEWGSVSETLAAPPRPVGSLPLGTVTKKIFPAYKAIDETVDILKFELAHTIGNVDLGDEFRYEHYQNSTKRLDDAQRNLTTLATKNVTVKEEFRHDAFSNVFHMESHLNDKTYWSAGYLFSMLSGDAGIRLNTVPFDAVRDKNWFTRSVDLDQDSHVVNLNLMVGPFAGFTANAGIQAERTESEGSADAILTEVVAAGPTIASPEAAIRTGNDKTGLEEIVGVRYTSIPYTTIYAEGRWVQQDIDLVEREFEDGTLEGDSAFKRFTETDVFRQIYTVGFNTSPLRRVNLAGRYRHTIRNNDYDNEVDKTSVGGLIVPLEGYSAFIQEQEFTTDEVSAKLTLRPTGKLSVSLQYQLVSTDIETEHEPVPALGIPSGELTSGEYDANIYSVTVTVTPIARMYLTGLFSFQDTRTLSYDHNAHSVITYQGNVYTIIGTMGYAIDNKTDITVDYTFSRAENFQNNGFDNTPKAGFTSNDYGLSLGIDNERHAATVTLARRFTENIIGRLRYGFYNYRETSNGGLDNYTAHLASVACTFRF